MKPYPIILHVIYTLPHAIFVDYRWFIYRFILKYVFNTYLCKCLYTDLSDDKYTFWIFSTIWNYVSFTSSVDLVLSAEIDESEVDFILEEFLTGKAFSVAFCRPVILMSPSCTVFVWHFISKNNKVCIRLKNKLDLN